MYPKIELGEEQLSKVEKTDVDISANTNVRDSATFEDRYNEPLDEFINEFG
jgi:hypothetical protein